MYLAQCPPVRCSWSCDCAKQGKAQTNHDKHQTELQSRQQLLMVTNARSGAYVCIQQAERPTIQTTCPTQNTIHSDPQLPLLPETPQSKPVVGGACPFCCPLQWSSLSHAVLCLHQRLLLFLLVVFQLVLAAAACCCCLILLCWRELGSCGIYAAAAKLC